MKSCKKAFLAALSLGFIVGLIGCQAARPADEVWIGLLEPLTGANAGGGALEREGVELANKLYPTVEVAGKTYKVVLKVSDNRSDKVESANAAERLMTKDKVDVILGSWGSSLSMAAGEIAKDKKVPMIGLSCTNPLVTKGNDYYFRVCFIDPFQGTVMANYAFEDLGAKTAVIISEVSNDYSIGLAKFFTDSFTALTGNPNAVLETVKYNTNDSDFNAQLTQVKSLNPEIIFAPGNFTESALIISQARALGIETQFIGADTWETNEFLDVGKAAVEGAIFSSFYEPDSDVDADDLLTATFLKEYDAIYHKKPSAVTALGFDGYLLALHAIMGAGSLDRKAIRDEIAKTQGFIGVTGIVNLDENGDTSKPAIIKKVEDGKFVFLKIVNPAE
ncbi:branched-chain amino acid ABC transporter substrate-binding protein [Spirochaetia bacterium]|nr:branched-chain amino acid ABC transporter substrate-binding protein [Spirochaetia bacterium]